MTVGMPNVYVALDLPSELEALHFVERMGDGCNHYKVGSQLFCAAGPQVVRQLVAAGKSVFVDLKFHDIPNTVERAVGVLAGLGASLCTVHAASGRTALACAAAAAGSSLQVFAVTALTSLSDEQWRDIGFADPTLAQGALRLAALAAEAGVHGVVCAAQEAVAIRERQVELKLLVPGIRVSGTAAGDQARIATPQEAVRAGADVLVIGRSVVQAPDPVAVFAQVQSDVERAWDAQGVQDEGRR
jgi:orotidine-5'-phosphate decarboxylase